MAKTLMAFLACVVLAGCNTKDNNAMDDDEAQYCRMVEIWKDDAAHGIKPNHRRGWPPFNGECTK